MNIIILGSGGFQTIPRPTCQCRTCKEARKKGIPYSRNGPSIYVKELKAVFDTPKDIINSINRENIKEIKRIFITHWHPDHTEGIRLVEEITGEWSTKKPYKLRNHGEPIEIIAPKKVMKDLYKIEWPKGSFIKFLEHQNFAKTKILNKKEKIGLITIKPIEINSSKTITMNAYLLEEKNKKVLYIPCDVKPFKEGDYLKKLDLLIVNAPYKESKKIPSIKKDHPLRNELFSIEEIKGLIEKYDIKKTILVHLEEHFEYSYDECKKLEKKYKQENIKFSYDGMKIRI